MEFITKSARETQKLGEKLSVDIIARKLSPRILCLYGDLGSGKTTFIQGFAKGLGITKRILSPTFIMMRQYQITNHKSQITNLFHIDLYRIDDEKGTESLGLEEIWSDPNNIVAIEWPEKIEKILPKKRIDIRFEYLDESSRQLTISNIAI